MHRIEVSTDVQGGTPVFRGTRVPIAILFDHLEVGANLEEFLAGYPSVPREHAIAVLEAARAQLAAADPFMKVLLDEDLPGLVGGVARADATRFSSSRRRSSSAPASRRSSTRGTRAVSSRRRSEQQLAVVGFVVSFVSGLAAVAFMVRFLRTNSLNWFIPYRLLLAAALLVAVVLGIA